jgi:hypothetical protein
MAEVCRKSETSIAVHIHAQLGEWRLGLTNRDELIRVKAFRVYRNYFCGESYNDWLRTARVDASRFNLILLPLPLGEGWGDGAKHSATLF